MDNSGKIHVDVVPACETWAKGYLEPIIQVAINKGWITRNYENKREFSNREYCQRGDCNCDPNSIEDWKLTPLPLCPKGEIIVQKKMLIDKDDYGIESKYVQLINANINTSMAPFIKRNFEYW